ncbi:copper amine oxidase [Paenibacillus sp. CAA11]|uniref:copper amine oxidase N-terminal domain-containing protein n=1 Tax=Paenibacillus sp. CAA11 TaxID=1532905 RepID=UPI000D394BA3|nr:copper amine oxidase N-terminal domain-containing protein [Paenibacillus sp. CAA11]AWB43061.1 copper amine oxidase [Paenibacillus sp. CAA11]
MKKLWIALTAGVMMCSVPFPTPTHAATSKKSIAIYIDGVKLATDQPPVAVQGRTLLPFRAIFEALGAQVNWDQRTNTVSGYKAGKSVSLKLGSKTASIDGQKVSLDVPAQAQRGRTLVPVRFVSEALGQGVDWNPATQTVTITSSTVDEGITAASYVSARTIGNSGDGRDIQVGFARVSNERPIAQYRVLMVKTSKASSFTLADAKAVPSGRYTVTYPKGSDQTVNLTAQTQDTDGEVLRSNQSYTAFVLSVGSSSNQYALSSGSPSVAPNSGNSVAAATNIRAMDTADYGDGRDLTVSFTKASTESDISGYRVMVVKTKDAGKFDLAAANAVSSSNWTSVSKNGTTLSTVLSSSSRDTSGELIKNGVPYTVFVLSVSNSNTVANKLSAGSSSITLGYGSGYLAAPVITSVSDVSDYGDGRDLRVSFNRSSDESRIGSYRIMVVKERDAGSFSLSSANNVSSYNYTVVGKTGYNISQVLSSSARDVNGDYIRSGISYRVFVLAVGDSWQGTNVLSAPSNSITLYSNTNVGAPSNVNVSDISDYGDGRDLQVAFTRAANESYVSSYRIMVVKSSRAGSFNLSEANYVSSYNYTSVSTTGYNQSKVLSAGARDVDGDLIRSGVSYRVFVMSVASNSYTASNALSSPSGSIVLSNQVNIPAASNVKAADVADYGDGRDLKVAFDRASNESNIGNYRVMVVKASNAGSFNLSVATGVSSYNYTLVNKNTNNLTLTQNTRDVDGDMIRSGESYRVFVLSVGIGSSSGTYALSSPSNVVQLAANQTMPATNVTANLAGNGKAVTDIQVGFARAVNEDNILEYRLMLVPDYNWNSFNLDAANRVPAGSYIQVSRGNDYNSSLDASAKDVNGQPITAGTSYRAYVLSVAKANGASNTLSAPSSGSVLLPVPQQQAPVEVQAVTNVGTSANANKISVTFTAPQDTRGITSYKVFVVPVTQDGNWDVKQAKEAAQLQLGANSTELTEQQADIQNAPLKKGEAYKVYIQSVADGQNTVSKLSSASPVVSIQQ